MAYTFNEEDKEVKEFNNNYFKFGITKVKIAGFTYGETEADKPYIAITVVDPENADCEDEARVWFTTPKSANYAFTTLHSIAMHNTPDAQKDDASAALNAVNDAEQLAQMLNEKLIGGECWLTKYYDPVKTYVNKKGDTKKSVNLNVYGYEPKLNESLMPAPQTDEEKFGVKIVDDVQSVIPGGKTDVPTSQIPKSW